MAANMRNTIDEWEDANVNIGSVSDNAEDIVKKRRGPVKWYDGLALQWMVFSVNYLHGLCYQVIKEAAKDRDKMMPEFCFIFL